MLDFAAVAAGSERSVRLLYKTVFMNEIDITMTSLHTHTQTHTTMYNLPVVYIMCDARVYK